MTDTSVLPANDILLNGIAIGASYYIRDRGKPGGPDHDPNTPISHKDIFEYLTRSDLERGPKYALTRQQYDEIVNGYDISEAVLMAGTLLSASPVRRCRLTCRVQIISRIGLPTSGLMPVSKLTVHSTLMT